MSNITQSHFDRDNKLSSLTVKATSLFDESLLAGVAARIDEFCANYGFFYVEDPVIGSGLARRAIQEARNYFGLPAVVKEGSLATPQNHFLGYRPIGSEASILGDQKEYCEQFKVGYLPLENGCSQSNVAEQLHNDVFEANGVLDYWNGLQAFSDRLLDVFGELLGFDEGYFHNHTNQPLHQLGLNFYPHRQIEPTDPSQAVSLQDHVDLGLFTVISQDVAGLEVNIGGKEYAVVPPKPGSFLVLLGEYMHLWSGGRYIAPLHRVVSQETRDRISIIYKHRPNYNSVIDMPLGCSDAVETSHQHYLTGREYDKKIYRIMGRELPEHTG